MKLVNVNPGETVQTFATRWGRTVDQVIADNPEEASLTNLSRRTGAMASLTRAGVDKLCVPDDAVESGGAPVQAAPAGPGPTPEPLHGLANPERNWLSYETLFNQRLYRKTNQRLELGLYRIPLNNVKIFVRDGIAKKTLEDLAAAFFPDLKVELIERISAETWKWKTPPGSKELAWVPRTPQKVTANRARNIYYAKQYAVLPYNFEDNGNGTHAIGHEETTEGGATLQKLKKTWGFWKTASRSVVVDLQKVKERDAPWANILDPVFNWPPATLPPMPDNADLGKAERHRKLSDEHAKGTQLKISNAKIALCGVKTGVQYVGWIDQTGVHKDKLEENSVIACLRSDLIVDMDHHAGRASPKDDPDFVIQTELLSITEVDHPDDPNRDDKWEFGDGVQIRDFTVLKRDRLYFPPISIPFVGRDLTQLKRRFECVSDKAWRDFWCKAYAERLGVAKAILLLRYGMQMGSPNAQNFLIEFLPAVGKAPPEPSGRVILRDVGDMYLHREVMWARFGGKDKPPLGPDKKTELKTLTSKIIQFECTTLTQGTDAEEWRKYVPYETGSVYEASYGKPGTRFNWHKFSTLAKGSSVFFASTKGTDPDAYADVWREACATMCEWGIAHNRAYVGHIEKTLRTALSVDNAAEPEKPDVINWALAPSPDRYRNTDPTNRESADRFYKEDHGWEDAQADKVHRFLASKEGQEAIRQYA